MGVDTKGYLKANVTAMDIYNVVLEKFDKEAIFDIRSDSDDEERGNIIFKYGVEQRQLFYCTGETERSVEFPLIIDPPSEKIAFLILGHWGSSVDIMTQIVKEFGGYVDENDCDDEDPYYISKDSDFIYSEYIDLRDRIMGTLDQHLNHGLKLQIASQLIKHKAKLKELL